jgi:hypothetical protein
VRWEDRPAAREQFRAAWKAWWKENGATINLARLQAGPVRRARVKARASASWKVDTTPERAFDDDRETFWNSGGYAPQWIEADLGATRQLGRLRLTVLQAPAGDTVHEVWVSDAPIGEERTRARLAHTFTGPTDAGQVLALAFPEGQFARYVQVRTTQSPSWVAWGDIELRVRRSPLIFTRE